MEPSQFRCDPSGSYFKALPRFIRERGELIVFWLWWRIVLPVGWNAETAYYRGFETAAGHMPRYWPYPLPWARFKFDRSGTWRTLPVTFRGPNVRVFMWLDWTLELPLTWTPDAAYQAGYDDGSVGCSGSRVLHVSMGACSGNQIA